MDIETSQTHQRPHCHPLEKPQLAKNSPHTIPALCIPQVGGDGHRELFPGSTSLEKRDNPCANDPPAPRAFKGPGITSVIFCKC